MSGERPVVVTVNAGSSSVRLAAFAGSERLASERLEPADEPRALEGFAARLAPPVEIVAHRIVHGGRLRAACELDDAADAEIARASELAPLHNPKARRFVALARARWPKARQVAVLDTAFFSSLPEVARSYALPRALVEAHGVERTGFHGLAHEAMSRAWGRGGRVISLQLGAGCSAAAILDGKPIDTSMGMTPLEGLVMATRAGDVDPGVLFYLQRRGVTGLERVLDEESGLRGLSGESGDVRALLASTSTAARRALDLFCYRARKYLGAYLAALGGADAILFGGGVGEHQPAIRARILDGMGWCGVTLDDAANARNEARISTGSVEVRVVRVDEEALLAEHAIAVIGGR